MVKRRLSGEELKMANKVLIQRKDELEWNEYQIGYYDMMLKTGLNVNYKKTVRDYKVKLNEFKSEMDMGKRIISELTSQIRNGVEVIPEVVADEIESEKEVQE